VPEEKGKMPKLALLDPTRTGKQAEDLKNKPRHLVIGQNEAIQQIVRVYQTHVAGLSPVGRPIGNFLFLGPTGSGKTRIVLFGDCIRVSYEDGSDALMFGREPETAPAWAVAGRAA
jgi:hypothetical protein